MSYDVNRYLREAERELEQSERDAGKWGYDSYSVNYRLRRAEIWAKLARAASGGA